MFQRKAGTELTASGVERNGKAEDLVESFQDGVASEMGDGSQKIICYA